MSIRCLKLQNARPRSKNYENCTQRFVVLYTLLNVKNDSFYDIMKHYTDEYEDFARNTLECVQYLRPELPKTIIAKFIETKAIAKADKKGFFDKFK